MSPTLLLAGLLLGLRHAFEADHLAVVLALASGELRPLSALRHGLAWGLGHAGMLLLAALPVLLLDLDLPALLFEIADAAVGLLLVLIGLDVLMRALGLRVHAHFHHHGDGRWHFHLHAHERGTPHRPEDHAHPHAEAAPRRAFLIGMLHGLSGSGALVVLILARAPDLATAVLELALFAAGSLLGMALACLGFALPLHLARPRRHGFALLRSVVGLGTLVIGLVLSWRSLSAFGG